MPRLHLIDGSGYIYRAFYALPPMQRSDGTPCGAVHGYCGMLWRLMTRLHGIEPPTHVAVVFDAGGPNHRHELYPEYKAHRKPVHEALPPQLPLIRKATEAFSIATIEQRGVEADDLIATYARLGAEAGWQVVVVSADKDLMQLIGGPVSVLRPVYGKDKPATLEPFGVDQVVEKFGVPPGALADLLALVGDTSDNIPGVPSIGEKTASKLLQNHGGTLDTLFDQINQVEPERTREMLRGHVNTAFLSRELVRLKDDVETPVSVHDLARAPIEPDRLCPFLEWMEFTTLANEYRNALEAA